jgi:hypothetical protein
MNTYATDDPNAALQALLAGAGLKAALFPPNSRYAGVDVATLQRPDGTTLVYVRRRFIPPPERYALLREHIVAEGERLDNLAARYLGDPEQFWRLCDANAVLAPEELEVPGRVLRITLPDGMPGAAGS